MLTRQDNQADGRPGPGNQHERLRRQGGGAPDKSARIVLYCRSGRMSEIAANTLAKAGYTNVVDVKGGFLAWTEAGYPLQKQ